jgi:hypothetical protein
VKLGNLAFWIFQSENGYLRHIAGQGAVTYPTLEAAKAAAQADYERRIITALDTPAPALMDELVEAHRENARVLSHLHNELQGRVAAEKLEALFGCIVRSTAALAKIGGAP